MAEGRRTGNGLKPGVLKPVRELAHIRKETRRNQTGGRADEVPNQRVSDVGGNFESKPGRAEAFGRGHC